MWPLLAEALCFGLRSSARPDLAAGSDCQADPSSACMAPGRHMICAGMVLTSLRCMRRRLSSKACTHDDRIPLCGSVYSRALPCLVPGQRARDYRSIGQFPCPTASPSISTLPSAELPERFARRASSDGLASGAELCIRTSSKASSQLQAASTC